MTLYILNYNNYYNRIVKREPDLSAYLDHKVVYVVENTNFNENDGISTSHVIGGASGGSYTGKGDYAIVVDDNSEITSRWFIIEAVRTRAGQYRLELYRDTIVDYYDLVVNSPMFIEKATVNKDNPLLFNNENMTFNQIKKSETLLKDLSGCPWIVGYYAKNAEDIRGTVKTNELTNIPAINIATPIKNWDYYKYINTPFAGVPTSVQYIVNARHERLSDYGYQYLIDSKTGNVDLNLFYDEELKNETLLQSGGVYGPTLPNIEAYVRKDNRLATMGSYVSAYADISTEQELSELLAFNGQLIRDSNGEVYLVTIYNEATTTINYGVTAGNLYNMLATMTQDLIFTVGLEDTPQLAGLKVFKGSASASSFKLQVTAGAYRVGLTRQQQYEVAYDLTSSDKLVTEDSPYNIFAIPYGEVTIKNTVTNTEFTTSADIGLNTAVTMQGLESTSNIYDLQLVPYCPVMELVTGDKEITVTNGSQYSLITLGSGSDLEVKGIIFNVPKANFSFDILKSIPAANSAIDKKVNNECDKWRLTSPNYSNYFDFSIEKNNGIQFFNVDCSYKPFTPYIHINPNFSGLYGYDDNSPRGLVLGGDFSLSQIVNQWREYQINNKNFQNVFDRQIQNMEVNNNISRFKEKISASVGVVAGAAGGAASGAMLGGGWGALAGGIIGAGAATVGGAMDIQINEKLRNEALDYTKDLFGYQLGNIQALPQTLSKVSSFNANNKIFPILEYYTATDVEKQALKDKIKYNGMTVMVIGKMQDYIQATSSYIKGQLIRLEPDMGEDYHIINTIAGELNKGVYI